MRAHEEHPVVINGAGAESVESARAAKKDSAEALRL
jgi:hypothetical protein